MNKITNRQAICEVLLEKAKTDRDIIVACSDSRGSASLAPFAAAFPAQFVEIGIAEQNLVTVSAGLAACGKKVFAAAPACFLSTRSYEQAKVDVAYSGTNVTLLGVSGGVSYGALGMSHHSCQDIAAMAALPGMRVYLPCDRFETAKLIAAILADREPAYIRVSRTPSADVYDEDMPFTLNQASIIAEGTDAVIIACGETVSNAVGARAILAEKGYSVGVIDMYCVKPLDTQAVIRAARRARVVVTAEEHSPFGGLGSMVAQAVSANCPRRVVNLSLPDERIIAGTGKEVFAYYGLDAAGIASATERALL